VVDFAFLVNKAVAGTIVVTDLALEQRGESL